MKKLLSKIGRFFKVNGISIGITSGVIAAAVVLNIVIYTLTSLFGLYLYKPETADLSISGATDELFAEAIAKNKKVEITFCMDENTVKTHATGSYVYETLGEFQERYPGFIEVNYVNILTRLDADGNRVNLEKYKQDMRGNDVPLRDNSVIFSSGEGREENYYVLTDAYTATGFADFFTLDGEGSASAYIGEEVFASMISWVLNKEHKTAYFISGHGETAPLSFSKLLTCAGYYLEELNLRDKDAVEKLNSDDTGLVVISEPTVDYERGSGVKADVEKLDAYLSRGGRIYVTLDPYAKRMPVLEGFLASHGITLSGREVENGKYQREMITDRSMGISSDGMTFVAYHADGEISSQIAKTVEKYGKGRVLVSRVSRIELSGAAKPLLLSSESSVCTAGTETVDTDGNYCVAAYTEVENEHADNGVMFVIPSTLLANSDVVVTNSYANKDFIYSVLDELFDSASSPYGCNSVVYNTDILENLTMRTARIMAAVIMSVPAAIAVVGAVIIIKRRRR